jgi:hypothetical protein
MASVRSNGLHDVVRAAVPLQDPNYRRVAEDKTVHPDGAILVDLAVHKEGVRTVLRKYGVIDFVPMSDDDPVVLSQPGETMEDKQVAAYENMLKRYSRYLYEECRLLGPMAKVWVAEKLAGIENQLSVIHPNRLEVGRLFPVSHIYANSADHTNSLSEIPKPPLGDYPKARPWRCCQRSSSSRSPNDLSRIGSSRPCR